MKALETVRQEDLVHAVLRRGSLREFIEYDKTSSIIIIRSFPSQAAISTHEMNHVHRKEIQVPNIYTCNKLETFGH